LARELRCRRRHRGLDPRAEQITTEALARHGLLWTTAVERASRPPPKRRPRD
jgi:hypothetical protein